jgi:hypothetical protein
LVAAAIAVEASKETKKIIVKNTLFGISVLPRPRDCLYRFYFAINKNSMIYLEQCAIKIKAQWALYQAQSVRRFGPSGELFDVTRVSRRYLNDRIPLICISRKGLKYGKQDNDRRHPLSRTEEAACGVH